MSGILHYLESAYRRQISTMPGISLDETDQRVRLNIVLPNYYKNFAFGGITSAMELGWAISAHYPEVRFISQAPLGLDSEMYDFPDYAACPRDAVQAVSLQEGPLSCRAGDIFLCTHHSTVRVWEAHAQAMRAAGLSPSKFYYFIQDYEPAFAPAGYTRSAAEATYTFSEFTRAIFNSRELYAYFHSRKLTFDTEHLLLPSLHPAILSYLTANRFKLRAKDPARTVIVCYGRPGSPRNCFETVLEGLYQYLTSLPEIRRSDFVLLSAGRPHEDISLCPGAILKSLGKLDIPQYVALLEHSHVGISLMASPHPSYPPLEMAAMGLQTITNAFRNKDLAAVHPNILSISAPLPELLARALPQAVARAVSAAGAPLTAVIPANMSKLPWRDNVRRARIPAIVPGGRIAAGA